MLRPLCVKLSSFLFTAEDTSDLLYTWEISGFTLLASVLMKFSVALAAEALESETSNQFLSAFF